MENQNYGSPSVNDLKKMFSDYQKKQTESTKKKKTSEEILAKYFVPRKVKETFRILPPKPGKRHIEEAFFHVVTTNASGGKKKHGTVIYCPAHNDPKVPKLDANGNQLLDGNGKPMMAPAPCPLCAKAKKELAKQDPSIKGIKKENMTPAQLEINENNKKIFAEANKWEAKKFYIVRGIDKGAEKDGVKFWRFKHNFKNQGVLDKLLPILDAYVNTFQVDFADPQKGCDLNLSMADSEFNGRTYKSLSAVIFGQPSPLHNDPLVAKQWLEDDIKWRDVFLPKRAPGISTHQYLELVVEGNNPYWDDTDSNNKHWVFPNHPELEAAANTRKQNLDADENDDNFEYASDLSEDEEPQRVTISNITPENVGKYKEDAVDITAKSQNVSSSTSLFVDVKSQTEVVNSDLDDLPF